MTFDKEEVLKKLYEELADNEWIIDDPWGPDNIEIPLHELHKRLRTILTQAYEAGRKEVAGEITKIANDNMQSGFSQADAMIDILNYCDSLTQRKDEE